MLGQLRYPKWNCNGPWWAGKGSITMTMNHGKWVIHSTETAAWPSYTYNGIPLGSAPTCTYNPWIHRWRGHFEANQSARALRNDGSHYTNRADVIQTEIVGYCDLNLAAKYGHAVTKIDQQAIDDLGDFGDWCHREWGVDVDFYIEQLPWPAYPKGVTRMTWDRYAGFSGILGHMAVPGNTHLDPGNLPLDKIKARMLGAEQDPWPHFKDTSAAVGLIQDKLRAAGLYHGRDPDNYYGPFTRNSIRLLQLAQGWTGDGADGLIGPATWALLQSMPAHKDSPHGGVLSQAALHSLGSTIRTYDALIERQPNRPLFKTIRAGLSGYWHEHHDQVA